MNRIVLFSPVGGTDPISMDNYKDGSLLHICRVYKPTDVYLYMSKEMCVFHYADNRYLYCLEKLEEQQGFHMKYHLIEKSDLKEVQEYDFFFDEFKRELNQIMTELDETDQLILNISSGTPAMKSGLLILATMGDLDCRCVQVITPKKSINEHNHKGYDVTLLWELNEDNTDDYENRCREVKCSSLSLIKTEETIKQLISKYDYLGALELAELSLPDSRKKEYINLIRMGKLRTDLSCEKAKEIAATAKFMLFPISYNNDPNGCKCFEYALQVQNRQKKGEYSDFLRSLSPLIKDLFERICLKQCGVNLKNYWRWDNKKFVWSRNKLKGSDIDKILQSKYDDDFRYGDISSEHIATIITDLLGEDSRVSKQVNAIRLVESSIRNTAAHEITQMTDEDMIEKTGYGSKAIMAIIKELFRYTNLNVTEKCWDSYEDMNAFICAAIDSRM